MLVILRCVSPAPHPIASLGCWGSHWGTVSPAAVLEGREKNRRERKQKRMLETETDGSYVPPSGPRRSWGADLSNRAGLSASRIHAVTRAVVAMLPRLRLVCRHVPSERSVGRSAARCRSLLVGPLALLVCVFAAECAHRVCCPWASCGEASQERAPSPLYAITYSLSIYEAPPQSNTHSATPHSPLGKFSVQR